MFGSRMGKTMRRRGEAHHQGMATFILLMDKFWDIVNVSPSSDVKSQTKRKPNCAVFTDPNDPRLTVCALSSHDLIHMTL